MVLQTITPVIYEIVSHSWSIGSILIKYYLAGTLALLYSRNKLEFERFREKLQEEGRIVITAVVAAGALLYLANLKPDPLFRLFSEAVALAYLGYLFWEY